MSIRASHTALVMLALSGLIALPQTAFAGQTATSVISGQTEAEPGGVHRAIRWAETELEEMDASITALEADSRRLQGEARTRADAALERLRATRDAYRAELQETAANAKERTVGEVERLREKLEADWNTFETGIENYYDAVDADVETRKAVFRARAEAQRAAFERRIEELNASAADASEEVKAAIARRKAALEESLRHGRAELDRLGEATGSAWAEFVKGLHDARSAFRETYDDES